MLDQKPFTRYKLDEEINPLDKTFTLRLSPKDRLWFEPAKKFIKQPKTSTAMKQLAEIGAIIVLHDKKISQILGVVMGNTRRNERQGIPETEIDKV